MDRWFDRNQRHDDWKRATWAERQLRDMLAKIILQNAAILAKLEDHKLSPEDQAKVDEIFAIETSDIAKIDTAQKT